MQNNTILNLHSSCSLWFPWIWCETKCFSFALRTFQHKDLREWVQWIVDLYKHQPKRTFGFSALISCKQMITDILHTVHRYQCLRVWKEMRVNKWEYFHFIRWTPSNPMANRIHMTIAVLYFKIKSIHAQHCIKISWIYQSHTFSYLHLEWLNGHPGAQTQRLS